MNCNSTTQTLGAAAGAASSLSLHQWTGVIQYLTTEDLKALRLVGDKEMNMEDPYLTRHLQLRMDKAKFFSSLAADAVNTTLDQARRWLTNRRRLVINDASAEMCPHRVAYLAATGYMDSISELVIFDCHAHSQIFSLLTQLPNLESLRLASHANEQEEGVLDSLECIVKSVGRIHSLKQLDIEFDCVIHGSRLSFLRSSPGIKHLRLRGFDLSDGISSMSGLKDLSTLHLCHGNFFSSPANDVHQEDLSSLLSLTKVERVHLEGFDCLSDVGLKPFSTQPSSVKSLVLKHCQDISDECLPSVGRMQHLTSLHIVHSAYDEVSILDDEGLQSLNSLVALKNLSLFYVLDNIGDLEALWALGSSLEVLNIALEEDLDDEDIETIVGMFDSLKKLRIFSEDCMGYSYQYGDLEVEYALFTFGDLLYLE